jgi:hypothetical protein
MALLSRRQGGLMLQGEKVFAVGGRSTPLTPLLGASEKRLVAPRCCCQQLRVSCRPLRAARSPVALHAPL